MKLPAALRIRAGAKLRTSAGNLPLAVVLMVCGACFTVLRSGAGEFPEGSELSPDALKRLSVEELMDIEVIIVSKRTERLSETASAIQVISGRDIRRSGAMTLPEALRLAPNLQVARVNAREWAITARGFNGAPLSGTGVANKLLVMVDGRSVYTPLFGGVFWDVQHVLLEDVDRIEVISGPGGTLWGANAVNGVINVITKSSRDTQGLFVTGAGGSFLQDFGAIRYGASAGSNLFFRVYGQRFDHNSTKLPGGGGASDAWRMTQGGFRTDWYPSGADTVTLQGDFYGGSEETAGDDRIVDGQNVLFRWSRAFSEESDLSVQFYFDRTWRDQNPPSGLREDLRTYDLDFQHRFPMGERHSILWGAGYRFMRDELNNSAAFSPEDRDMQLFSGFVQDEIALVPERLRLVLGTKLEHNEFSGLEVQPNARVAWTPVDRHVIWGAISRAVRSPSRFDADVSAPLSSQNFDSEKVLAYELGYRVRPVDSLSLSLAAFFNEYDDLRSIRNPAPGTFIFANDQHAETWGIEFAGSFQATAWWRLRGGYTYLHERVWTTEPTILPGSDTFEAIDPSHQFLLQSTMDLPRGFQFDLVGRYVDDLPASPASPAVSDYFTFDARLAWRRGNWELAVVGQNLWDHWHSEFGAREIPRSVYGKVTVRW